VPTAEVLKVSREMRFRAGKGFLWGMVAALPASAVVGANQGSTAFFGSSAKPIAFLMADVAGGLIGLVVVAGLKLPPDLVVYVAPSAAAQPARSGLLPPGDRDDRRCRLAAADAPPGAPALVCGPASAAQPPGRARREGVEEPATPTLASPECFETAANGARVSR
jgi:hypothetical protein